MENIKLKDIIPYFLMFPAILIGMLAMISYGVSSSIWMQNIIIWIVGSILGCVYLTKTKQKQFGKMIGPIFMIVLLIAPFWFNRIEGIHRWIQIGPLNFYVASIFLPLLMIFLLKLLEKKHYRYVTGLNFVVQVILLFQPDAGQVTAFACAHTILFWNKMNNSLLKLFNLTFTTVIVILSWIFIDDLAAVPYVEHILFLVKDMGGIWFIFGLVSLLLLLIPFFFYGKVTTISLTFGVYFLVMMLVTFFGHFPMPIMGYGISPVIGYITAITYLNKINR
jgi:cell division protein FtsW (lipid II flippase)